jgi:transposase-like protein
MALILPGIHSLVQHLQHLQVEPETYRPARCPHCGKARVWCHGVYTRKADRDGTAHGSLNPIPIARFLCACCRQTCSRLPECLSPRRWYSWAVQETVLAWLIAGHSMRWIARQVTPSRRTVRRWWQQLQARFAEHALCLRSRFPELGRAVSWRSFWQACLSQMRLSTAMSWIQQAGHPVP